MRRTAATMAAKSGDPFAVEKTTRACKFDDGNKICTGYFCTDGQGYRK